MPFKMVFSRPQNWSLLDPISKARLPKSRHNLGCNIFGAIFATIFNKHAGTRLIQRHKLVPQVSQSSMQLYDPWISAPFRFLFFYINRIVNPASHFLATCE